MKTLKAKKTPLLSVLCCPPKVAESPDRPNLGRHLQMIKMTILIILGLVINLQQQAAFEHI